MILFGTVPHIMIAFASAQKSTAVLGQYIADFLFILSHLCNDLGAAFRGKFKVHVFMLPAVQFQNFRSGEPGRYGQCGRQKCMPITCKRENTLCNHGLNLTRIESHAFQRGYRGCKNFPELPAGTDQRKKVKTWRTVTVSGAQSMRKGTN